MATVPEDYESLSLRLRAVAVIVERVAWELADLEDGPDTPERRVRRAWLEKQATDLITRFRQSKLYHAETFRRIHGPLIEADHRELVESGVSAAEAKERLRIAHGYEGSAPTAIRDVLTDYRRIRGGKAPRKPRTRKLSQK